MEYPTRPPCLIPLTVDEFGILFERKMAALLILRLHRLKFKFLMYKNVAITTPLDDIVIFLQDQRYLVLVQLKHGRDPNSSAYIQQFVPRKAEEGKSEKGDFNLRKYFNWYKHFYEFYEGRRTPESDGEIFLSRVPIDKVWCIIYTNKVIKGLSSSSSKHETSSGTLRAPYGTQNLQDLKMLELFVTSSRGEIIQFHESENLVWNFMKNQPGEKIYQENFLPRLVIFSGQEHVNGLDEIVTEEIRTLFGRDLHSQTERNILFNYFESVKEWWLEPKGNWVCEDTRLLDLGVAQELRRQARDAAGNKVLSFRDISCTKLADILSSRPRYLRILVPDMPVGLRAAKLLQILETKIYEGERFNWSYVNDRTVKMYSPNELKKICCSCDLIILDIDCQCNHSFIKDVRNRCGINIMIIIFVRILDGDGLFFDEWTMNDLNEQAQKSFLQRTIKFQGEDVVLGELVSAYPALSSHIGGKALANLATGQTFTLGKPLPPMDSFYVPRIVQHRTVLKETIFNVRSRSNSFVLRGFPDEILSRLRSRDSPWQECKSSWAPIYKESDLRNMTFRTLVFIKENIGSNVRTRWVKWYSEIEIDKHYDQNIHWLTYYQKSILWDESKGDSDIIIEHIKEMSDSCEFSPICQHRNEDDLIDWLDQSIVLPDITGMGKTMFLRNMANNIKKRYKTTWVIYIGLNDKTIPLPRMVEKEDVFKVLCQEVTKSSPNSQSTSMEVEFLKHCLFSEAEERGKVTVLVDAIDEVCPAYKENVLMFLGVLQEILKKIRGRLCVAARTVLIEDLGQTLQCAAPLSLLPFSSDDQCKYLLNCWADVLQGVEESDRSRQVQVLVDVVRSATRRSTKKYEEVRSASGSLCDVPLYTKFLSEIYKGDKLTSLLGDEKDTIASKINRLHLYENFVRKTLDSMLKKWNTNENHTEGLDIIQYTEIKYQQLAVEKCFYGREELLEIMRPHLKCINPHEHIEINAHDGLVTLVSGKPEFIHFSVAEYLAAKWLFDHMNKKIHPVIKALYVDQLGECRYFFDALLADNSEIHMAALTSNRDDLRRLLTKVNNIHSGGRNPLHLAAIAGNVSVFMHLLAAGANPHVKDALLNWTPLRYANELLKKYYKNGILENVSHMALIEKLITKGCKSQDISNLLKDKDLVIYAVERGYVNIVREVLNKTNSIINLILNNKPFHNYELVYFAAKKERMEVLNLLKARGVKVNRIEKGNDLSLHDAIKYGFVEMCDLLLKMGADINARDDDDETPLHCAARSGSMIICKKLLNNGADFRVRNKRNQTVLFHAVREAHDNIKRTLTKLTSVQPTYEEVEKKHVQLVKFLLDSGMDVREMCDGNSTALHIASFVGCEPLVRLLINKGLEVNIADKNSITSLHWAVLGGHEPVCLRLIEEGAKINHKDSDGYTALHCAAVADHLQICDILLTRGAKINLQCNEKSTCLHRAAKFSHVSFCEFLLDKGADPNIEDINFNTPLHLTAFNGSTDICQMLIENGADLSKRDIKGWQPIHLASSQGHAKICSLIKDNGGDIMARLPDGSTPLHVAAMKGHDDVCRLMIQYGANINAIQYQRNTPLHLAVFAEEMNSCHVLLENRADFNIKNIQGYTVIHILADTGKLGMLKLLVLYVIESNRSNTQMTVEDIKRDCLSGQTTEGSTPLHLASRKGYFDVCKYLIECKVDVNKRDYLQKRPVHYAVQNGHNLLANYLVQKGAIVSEA